jgi:hypothetical protein
VGEVALGAVSMPGPIAWGADRPVPDDYDSDGKVDPAAYRPSTGQWFILLASTNYTTYIVKSVGRQRRRASLGRLRR